MRTSYSNKAQEKTGSYIGEQGYENKTGQAKRHDIAQETNTHGIVSYTREVNGVGKPDGEGAAAERRGERQRRQERSEHSKGGEHTHTH